MLRILSTTVANLVYDIWISYPFWQDRKRKKYSHKLDFSKTQSWFIVCDFLVLNLNVNSLKKIINTIYSTRPITPHAIS